MRSQTASRKDENEARLEGVLTHDEARRIAANIARLPELVVPENPIRPDFVVREELPKPLSQRPDGAF